MSSRQQEEHTQEHEQAQRKDSASSSSSLSASNSISLIKLDELSSFGATKKARLPALIKLNPLADQNSRHQQQDQQRPHQQRTTSSMPDFSGSQLENMTTDNDGPRQQSLPAQLEPAADKENAAAATRASLETARQAPVANQDESLDGFQVLGMDQLRATDSQMVGPSLPAQQLNDKAAQQSLASMAMDKSLAASLSNQHLGDSLIEMIINLRNENQELIKALEVNNSYVKDRLSEFKRCQEESKKRESQFQLEKAELEHNLRKVQRQNSVLSERLKSMEAKLKDMKLEVSESLSAAHSSKTSSIRGEDNLYPHLGDDSFGNAALEQHHNHEAACTTMQVDAASGELYNDGDCSAATKPMETDQQQAGASGQSVAQRVANMSKEELGKRFDADKAEFYALDDPMKQCDRLEKQLNNIGKRDYEICLLQQQLNIYRQDFRLERMAKLEAKIQIEKLKGQIDRLCLERMDQTDEHDNSHEQPDERQRYGPTPATAAADGLIGKLGHHLSRKALKSAAKAAKYASKQAHLEEKAAAALARAAAAKAAAASHFKPAPAETATAPAPSQADGHEPAAGDEHPHPPHHHHSRRHQPRAHQHHPHPHPHSHHHHHRGMRSVRNEIVSDLMSTANKAMLTGYNLASTTINSALDKLSQYEQQQASQLADQSRTRQTAPSGGPRATGASASGPSAPPMDEHPSVD